MTLRKNIKRVLAIVLALSMTMSLLTVTAFADGEERVLVCEKEEHIHTEECYEKVLVCGLEETPEPESEPEPEPEPAPETQPQVMPGAFELPGIEVPAPEADETETAPETGETENLPNEEVPMSGAPAINVPEEGLDEGMMVGDEADANEPETQVQPHTHTEDCYEEVLVCGKEEHTHTDDCYKTITVAPTADEIQNDGGIMTIANPENLPSKGNVGNGTYDLGGQTLNLTGSLTISGNANVTLQNGTINANGNGSAIILSGNAKLILKNVTIYGGTGTTKKDDERDTGSVNGYKAILDYTNGVDSIKCGGGILLIDNSKLEMYDTTIRNNTADFGGGIAAFRSTNVKIYGGCKIYENTSEKNGGGGMFLAGKDNVIDPTIGNKDILIYNNKTNSKRDLGGGGFFVDSAGSAFVKNAMIYSNDAGGMGGGIAGCLHGMVSIVDPDMAAVYENTAKGTSLNTATKRGFIDNSDWPGWKDINEDNSRDYLVAGYSLVGPQSLGGGFTKWQGVAVKRVNKTGDNGVAVNTFDGKAIEVDGILGLKVTNDAEVKAAAESNTAPKTRIYNNYSAMHGGGIGTNGLLKFGEETWDYSYSNTKISIYAHKNVAVTTNKPAQSLAGYTFELLNGDKIIATATTDADGNIKFENILTSALFGPGTAQGTQSLTKSLTLREVADNNHPGVVFDTAVRQISITVSRNVVVKHPHTEDGDNKNSVTLYETTDKIANATVSVNGTTVNVSHTENSITLTGAANFTNQYKTGSISITKVISGIENSKLYEGKKFQFTLTGNNHGKKITETFTLSAPDNLTKTFEDLPVGTYTITETSHDEISGFKWNGVEYSATSVTVTDGGTAEFTATNKYELKRVSLTLSKALELVSDTDGNKVDQKYLDHEFTFKISGTDIEGNPVPAQEITIKADKSGTFTNLPGGTYTITESNYNIPDFAYQSVTVGGSSITDTDDDNHKITFTLTGEEYASITFTATNKYDVNRVQLVIKKDVLLDGMTPGEANEANKQYVENQEFTFEITGTDPNGNAINFGNGTTKTVTVTVDANGHGISETLDLPVGNYTIRELDKDIDHYTFKDVTFTSSTGELSQDGKTATLNLVGQNVSGEVTFTATNYYTVQHTDLSLEKVVKLNGVDNNGHDLVKGLRYVFRVTGTGLNGESMPEAVVPLNAENGWKATITNLPVGTYTIEEVSAPDVEHFHYVNTVYTTGTKTGNGTTFTLNPGDSFSVTATNSYEINRTSFSVSKAIDVTGSQVNTFNGSYFNDHRFTFTLTLVEAADGFTQYEGAEYTVTLTNNKATFSNLPVGVYTLTESGTEVTDYIWNGVSIENGTVTKNQDGSFTVDLTNQANNSSVEVTATNTYTLKEGSFGVTKTVILDGKNYNLAPDDHQYTFAISGTDLNGNPFSKQITVGVGTTYYFKHVPYGTYTITEMFTNLEYYNFEGVELTGTGLEKMGDNQWQFTIKDSNNGTFAVSATNTYERKLDEISVTKKIEGNFADYSSKWDFTMALKSPASYVELAGSYTYTVVDEDGNQVKTGSIVPTGETVELDGETYTVYGTVSEIGDDETATITGLPVGVQYKFTEVQENADQYHTSYSNGMNGRGTVVENGDNSTTVHNSKSIYTAITVTKNWQGDRPSQRPDSITAELYQDGTLIETFELNAANNWTKSWSGMTFGATYTVREVNVPAGYVATYGGNFSGSNVNITITNTSEQDYTSFSVRKVWQGDDAATRPASITVQLLADGEAYGSAVTLSEANSWAYTWTGLDPEKNYTVSEVNVPEGYESMATANGREYIITNTWAPKTSVTVNKVWVEDDGTEATEMLPDSITVNLYNGEQLISSVVLTEANGWSYTWTGLDARGDYSVEEVEVDGWWGSMERSGNVFLLTNERDTTTFEDEEPPRSDRPDEPDEDIEIPDDDIPLDYLPFTGDDGALAFWLAMSALSGTGLLITCLTAKKRKVQDGEDKDAQE